MLNVSFVKKIFNRWILRVRWLKLFSNRLDTISSQGKWNSRNFQLLFVEPQWRSQTSSSGLAWLLEFCLVSMILLPCDSVLDDSHVPVSRIIYDRDSRSLRNECCTYGWNNRIRSWKLASYLGTGWLSHYQPCDATPRKETTIILKGARMFFLLEA